MAFVKSGKTIKDDAVKLGAVIRAAGIKLE